jgi:hypothetical protein
MFHESDENDDSASLAKGDVGENRFGLSTSEIGSSPLARLFLMEALIIRPKQGE